MCTTCMFSVVCMQAWSGCGSTSGPDEACVSEATGEEGGEEGGWKEKKTLRQ